MKNIINVDFQNDINNGVYCVACGTNILCLCLTPSLSQKTNYRVEVTDINNSVHTSSTLELNCNNQIEYQVDSSYFNGTGVMKIRLLSDESNSDYINFTCISFNENNDIICKYSNNTYVFFVNKKDNSISATSVIDIFENENRNQHEINSIFKERVDTLNKYKDSPKLTKDYIETNTISSTWASNDYTRIKIIPKVIYDEIDPTGSTSTYCRELLKWICRTYPNHNNYIFMGLSHPNSIGIVFIQIYSTNDVSNGIPRYSTGMNLNLNGLLCTFGTYNYTFNYANK